jgi:hypothetical protein
MTLNKSTPHIPSLIQLVVSGSCMLFLWGVALIYGLMGVFQLAQGSQPAEFGAIFVTAIDIAVLGLLVFPSTLFSFTRLINRPIEIKARGVPHGFLALILAWPLILTLGNILLKTGGLALYLFPIAQVSAVLVLAFWFFLVAGMGLERSSPQWNWGMLSAGMLGGTFLSLLFEILGGILLLAGIIVLVMINPVLQGEFSQLASRLANIGSDMDALMRILTPYLTRPAVIITMVFSISVAVPLMEEALKPIGLWFISRKELTPAQGFMGGVISGAGFALIESLLNTARLLDESWIIVSSLRFGTTLIHMLASGLVGWGLASAWSQRKYLRLAGAYLAAVLLHGIWNGFAILFAVSQISPGHTPEFLSNAGKIAMWGLGVWTVMALIVLLIMNFRLRTITTASPEI